jgi:hypothetical protein
MKLKVLRQDTGQQKLYCINHNTSVSNTYHELELLSIILGFGVKYSR